MSKTEDRSSTTTTTDYSGQAIFRHWLQEEFLRRRAKNSAYSLRAFAAHVDVDQSLLSKVFRGQRKFSDSAMQAIGLRLDATPALIANFNERQVAKSSYDLVSNDHLSVIADWFHFAILELMKTRGFKNDFEWISQRLGIHCSEVQIAFERLERLGYIAHARSRKGWTLLKPDNSWTSRIETSSARKKLQKTLIDKAGSAIELTDFKLRENASLTVAVDPKLLPRIREKMQQFSREIDQMIADHGQETEVYQLVLSLFPLTNDDSRRNEK